MYKKWEKKTQPPSPLYKELIHHFLFSATQVQRDIHIRERVYVCEKNSQIFTLHHCYLNTLLNN